MDLSICIPTNRGKKTWKNALYLLKMQTNQKILNLMFAFLTIV